MAPMTQRLRSSSPGLAAKSTLLLALLEVNTAAAYAKLGVRDAAIRTLGDHFDQADRAAVPAWLNWLNEAQLCAMEGFTWPALRDEATCHWCTEREPAPPRRRSGGLQVVLPGRGLRRPPAQRRYLPRRPPRLYGARSRRTVAQPPSTRQARTLACRRRPQRQGRGRPHTTALNDPDGRQGLIAAFWVKPDLVGKHVAVVLFRLCGSNRPLSAMQGEAPDKARSR